MIPATSYDLDVTFTIATEPSYTYKLDTTNNRISGYIDELEAMQQAIYKIVNTERYQHAIYSWNYGIELQDLIGRSRSYVYSKLKQKISEALLQDDRINEMGNFSFEDIGKKAVLVKFIAYTIYGAIESERVVNY
ncbi:MAG TPA: DUF2634 domain-containing protein [Syntrophomonas sp.]|nr:DUF2634 domain-containing protein [Syntrophomonas sp.]